MVYKKGTKEIDKRYLQLCNGGINKNSYKIIQVLIISSINISNRRKDFVLNVMSFDYDKDILNSFVDYWTEPTNLTDSNKNLEQILD